MNGRRRAIVLAAWIGGVAGGSAVAAEGEPAIAGGYGTKGTLELGGGIDAAWTSDLFVLGLTPTIGYFVRDRVELALRLGATYENAKSQDGSRDGSAVGAIVLEPSYHLPLRERLCLFGGLGVGAAHDGDHASLDVLPRVGFNVEVGRSGVLTPAIRVPILVGRGITLGAAFELGMTTTF